MGPAGSPCRGPGRASARASRGSGPRAQAVWHGRHGAHWGLRGRASRLWTTVSQRPDRQRHPPSPQTYRLTATWWPPFGAALGSLGNRVFRWPSAAASAARELHPPQGPGPLLARPVGPLLARPVGPLLQRPVGPWSPYACALAFLLCHPSPETAALLRAEPEVIKETREEGEAALRLPECSRANGQLRVPRAPAPPVGSCEHRGRLKPESRYRARRCYRALPVRPEARGRAPRGSRERCWGRAGAGLKLQAGGGVAAWPRLPTAMAWLAACARPTLRALRGPRPSRGCSRGVAGSPGTSCPQGRPPQPLRSGGPGPRHAPHQRPGQDAPGAVLRRGLLGPPCSPSDPPWHTRQRGVTGGARPTETRWPPKEAAPSPHRESQPDPCGPQGVNLAHTRLVPALSAW